MRCLQLSDRAQIRSEWDFSGRNAGVAKAGTELRGPFRGSSLALRKRRICAWLASNRPAKALGVYLRRCSCLNQEADSSEVYYPPSQPLRRCSGSFQPVIAKAQGASWAGWDGLGEGSRVCWVATGRDRPGDGE